MSTAHIPFTLDAKSADPTTELEDGSLIVGGFGLVYDEEDSQNEGFLEMGGRLLDGLKSFLRGPAPVLADHLPDRVMGRVLSADHVPGRGIYVKCLLDPQPKWSPLRPMWEAAKRGRLSYSVGGVFDRVQTPKGPRISRVRVAEWTITSTPVGGPSTALTVLAGKALTLSEGKSLTTRGEVVDASDLELERIGAQLDRMAVDVAAIRAHRLREVVR